MECATSRIVRCTPAAAPRRPPPSASSSKFLIRVGCFFHGVHHHTNISSLTTRAPAPAALHVLQNCKCRKQHQPVGSSSHDLCVAAAAAATCGSHVYRDARAKPEMVTQYWSCNGFVIAPLSLCCGSRRTACAFFNVVVAQVSRRTTGGGICHPQHHGAEDEEEELDSESDGDDDDDVGGQRVEEQPEDHLQTDDLLQNRITSSQCNEGQPPPLLVSTSSSTCRSTRRSAPALVVEARSGLRNTGRSSPPVDGVEHDDDVIAEDEAESWLLMQQGGGDSRSSSTTTLVSTLPLQQRYAPRRLLKLMADLRSSAFSRMAQLRSTFMFWQRKHIERDDRLYPAFGSCAFQEKGIPQLHQWTATELTMQHAQLSRIARDVLYLTLACSLLGIARVLEALVAAFSSSPPRYAKLLAAANSLDFFTIAFLAHSLRKPIIGILDVDPCNLDHVFLLKAKIWDEMHKFYERQWKVVATLGVGRLLTLLAQTIPSTNTVTKYIKMCWDMLLALPIS